MTHSPFQDTSHAGDMTEVFRWIKGVDWYFLPSAVGSVLKPYLQIYTHKSQERAQQQQQRE